MDILVYCFPLKAYKINPIYISWYLKECNKQSWAGKERACESYDNINLSYSTTQIPPQNFELKFQNFPLPMPKIKTTSLFWFIN